MGTIVLGDQVGAQGATLGQYRRRAAPDLGPFRQGTATSGSAVTYVEENRWPVRNIADVEDRYVDQFIYRPGATADDRDRGVASYDPSQGRLYADIVYGAAPADGEAYELLGLLPGSTVNELVNFALKRIPIVVEVAFNPPADQKRISLLNYASWLTNKAWVRQVGYLSDGANRDEDTPTRVYGEAVVDRGIVYLDCQRTFEATDTLYVVACAPAYVFCRASGGSFGDQSGLTLETDEAIPGVNLVAYGVAVEAWRRHSHLLEASTNQRLIRDQQAAAALFTSEARSAFQSPDLTFTKLRSWGPR